MTLHETGSTLLYPLFQLWISDYAAATPGTTIATDATGSGAGIGEAIAGHVQIGASDAYMSDEQAERNRTIVNIPLAISAQTVNYNLPGLGAAHLKLDGPTLAGIYSGTVRTGTRPRSRHSIPGCTCPTRRSSRSAAPTPPATLSSSPSSSISRRRVGTMGSAMVRRSAGRR